MIRTERRRKLSLTLHVVSSVGWLGALVTFLALAVTGLASRDAQLVRAVYLVAEPITWFVIVPLALATLVTGLVQSLGTTWGLFRHYWVLFKLLIAVLATTILLIYTQTVSYFAALAADPGSELSELRAPTFVLHSSAALLLLLAAAALSVYKPRGMTRYGRRKQAALRSRQSP